MIPKILAVIPGLIPSVELYVITPLLELHQRRDIIARFVLFDRCKEADVVCADIVVFCRNSQIQDLRTLYWARKHHKRIIYDIDDNFFELPLATSLGIDHRNPGKLYVLHKLLQNADIVRTYSPQLTQDFGRFSDNVEQVKAYFNMKLLSELPVKRDLSKIKIVYATGRGHEDTLGYIFEDALKKIAIKYKDTVEINIWGAPSQAFQGLKNVKFNTSRQAYNQFIVHFYTQGYDIGLAPLEDTIFMMSKNNTKYRDYGACGIAGVYSNVSPYRECIANLHNGILAENTPAAWFSAIELLVENCSLRERIRANSFVDIQENYSFESFLQVWLNMIRKVSDQNFEIGTKISYLPALRILAIAPNQNTLKIASSIFWGFLNFCDAFNPTVNFHMSTFAEILEQHDWQQKFDVIVFFGEVNSAVIAKLNMEGVPYILADERNSGIKFVRQGQSCFIDKTSGYNFVNMNFINTIFGSQTCKCIYNEIDGENWSIGQFRDKIFYRLQASDRCVRNNRVEVNDYFDKTQYSLESSAVKWAALFEQIFPQDERVCLHNITLLQKLACKSKKPYIFIKQKIQKKMQLVSKIRNVIKIRFQLYKWNNF